MQPDPERYLAILTLAVREAEGMGSPAPTEDPVERMRAQVREASNRLVAAFMAAPRPLDTAARQALAQRAVGLAATTIRGLNDCIGSLGGFVMINEARVEDLVVTNAGAPSADPEEISEIDPEIDGWLTATNIHVPPVTMPGTDPEFMVREAFAVIGAASALASALMPADGAASE